MKTMKTILAVALATAVAGCASMGRGQGASAVANLEPTKGNSAKGTVTFTQHGDKVRVNVQISGLNPGAEHGFHVHENSSCAPKEKDGKMVAALGAGGHYDPMATKHHGTPWGDGHLGDLPALYVDPQGSATNPVLAPRLKMAAARRPQREQCQHGIPGD